MHDDMPFQKGDKYYSFSLTGEYIKKINERGRYWECICICGEKRYLQAWRIKSGNVKSCGCQSSEYKRQKQRKRIVEGERIGMFVLTGLCDYRYKKEALFVEALCECGSKKFYRYDYLINGHTKSCGCKKSSFLSNSLSIHGHSKSRLYGIWKNMIRRCLEEKSDVYMYYGGRGIKICIEWQNSFEIFKDWSLKNGYDNNLTIDRKDNDGNYEPDNCRWTTRLIQSRNTRKTIFLNIFNENKSLRDWADDYRCKVSADTLYIRITKLKWDIEKALITPICYQKINVV